MSIENVHLNTLFSLNTFINSIVMKALKTCFYALSTYASLKMKMPRFNIKVIF